MNKEQEQQLVKIVRLANTQIQEFEQEINGRQSVILLVGDTGSGKSTLFNFLIGAQFQAKQGSQYFELELESNSEKYSVMKEGLTSVTKVPKCFYQQQYKSLIVDFPGFNDTNGEIDEIVIQSLFNKITSKSDVKIVLVNNQPQVNFSRRGVDLQDFLNQVLRNQIVKLDNITLLMNRFSKQIPDEEIIAKWQTEIEKKFGNKVGKILIQRGIRKAEDINEYLSDQQREKIWKSISETPQFKLHPFKFKNSTLINNYLIESINRIIFQTFQELDSLLSQQKDLSLEQLVELLKWYQNINRLIKDSTLQNLSNWINDYLNHLQQISEVWHFQSQLQCNVQNFLSIYEFFFDFQNELDGYQQIKSTLETISRSCQITIQNIENTNRNLRSLEKEKQEKENEIIKRKTAEEETKTVKIELNQIKRDLDQAVENFKNEEKEKIKAIKETNEVKTQLEDTQNQRDEANKLKEEAEQEKEQAQNETEKIKTQLETTEIEMDNAKKEMGQAQELQKKAQEETNTVKQQLSETDKMEKETLTKLQETINKKNLTESEQKNVTEQSKLKSQEQDRELKNLNDAKIENETIEKNIVAEQKEIIRINENVGTKETEKQELEKQEKQILSQKLSIEESYKQKQNQRGYEFAKLNSDLLAEQTKAQSVYDKYERLSQQQDQLQEIYLKSLSSKKSEIYNNINKQEDSNAEQIKIVKQQKNEINQNIKDINRQISKNKSLSEQYKSEYEINEKSRKEVENNFIEEKKVLAKINAQIIEDKIKIGQEEQKMKQQREQQIQQEQQRIKDIESKKQGSMMFSLGAVTQAIGAVCIGAGSVATAPLVAVVAGGTLAITGLVKMR